MLKSIAFQFVFGLMFVVLGVVGGFGFMEYQKQAGSTATVASADAKPAATDTTEDRISVTSTTALIPQPATTTTHTHSDGTTHSHEPSKPSQVLRTNGSVGAVGYFSNGKQVGNWKYYYSNEALFSEGKFDNKGWKQGMWTTYYPNGNRKLQGWYSNDVQHGKFLFFPFVDRQDCFWTANFKNNKRDGEWVWHVNSVPQYIERYRNDVRYSWQSLGGATPPAVNTTVWYAPDEIVPE